MLLEELNVSRKSLFFLENSISRRVENFDQRVSFQWWSIWWNEVKSRKFNFISIFNGTKKSFSLFVFYFPLLSTFIYWLLSFEIFAPFFSFNCPLESYVTQKNVTLFLSSFLKKKMKYKKILDLFSFQSSLPSKCLSQQ